LTWRLAVWEAVGPSLGSEGSTALSLCPISPNLLGGRDTAGAFRADLSTDPATQTFREGREER